MPYLRKHAPGTPRKVPRADDASTTASPTTVVATTTTTMPTTMPTTRIVEQTETPTCAASTAERTPPQEPRVPEIGEATAPDPLVDAIAKRKRCAAEPTTPVLPSVARKQSTITDFMKTRKRGLNGTTKSMIESPEKIARNAGQIRS
ncbi:hypothetical protein EAG_09511 [Camponotus floridanus]|uniref:Uncharacterized protein n=2 Tax=Camponotus floridanus TaxID=104421 RepID=E1ZZ79_CAMFO|nr:hypothetical protein EAG_09511 [Camponotus floridanus]